MKYIKLTDPQGRDVWIRASWVTRASMPTSDVVAPHLTNTIVWLGGERQAVREHLADVVALLEQAEA
jgi:hypothetical protein